MNLNLTSQEMEVLLSLTANHSFMGEINDSLWRKVSAEFVRRYDEVKGSEQVKAMWK